MALRGTLTHRKTRRLGNLMHIPACFALGIVESLWHVTGEQAPTGAIGKMSDEDIAMEMFYDGDAPAMILALVQSGFLEANEEHRLIVHDWHIHASNSVRLELMRRGERFADGSPARPNQHLRIEGSTKRTRRRDREESAGGAVTRIQRLLVFKRDKWSCRGCGSTVDLTIDHITPISHGGRTVVDNLQALCRPCNSAKKDKVSQ
jgi:hypothetical protein